MGKRNKVRKASPAKPLSHLKIFIATPAYDGKLTVEFVSSLVSTFNLLSHLGAKPHFEALSGVCYLPVVRNKLLKRFLVSDATDLLFLDADVGFDPAEIARLFTHNVDIVGGAVPFRAEGEGYPTAAVMKNGKVNVENGLIETGVLATAVMRIRKPVFLKFTEEFGERLVVIEREWDGSEKDRYLNIFDTGQIGDRWWGEDTRFCDVWRQLGGRLWIDPNMNLTHTGMKTWRGNYGEYLKRNGHL